ncbi:alpha/beta fold hydrolase, partial [Actinoplanes solisilvae]|uniref:alpha/beta fold hydrolase n=1 Tax=Actinoplanes solisilvae TaxID=2486853 RepID=UPI003D792B01
MTETLPDARRGERACWLRWLPGQPVITDQWAGQAELGERGQDEPGPPVGLLRGADFRDRPAQDLFGEPECVFDVETAQVGAPDPVEVQVGWVVAVPPQPYRFRFPVTTSGQPGHVQFPLYLHDYWRDEEASVRYRKLFDLSPVSSGGYSFDVRAHLGRISVPVLALTGRHDHVCGPRWTHELGASIPDATEVVL